MNCFSTEEDVDERHGFSIAFIIKVSLDLVNHALDVAPDAGCGDFFDDSIDLIDEVDHDVYFLLQKVNRESTELPVAGSIIARSLSFCKFFYNSFTNTKHLHITNENIVRQSTKLRRTGVLC